jgi:selenocysteine-specific elongation factor
LRTVLEKASLSAEDAKRAVHSLRGTGRLVVLGGTEHSPSADTMVITAEAWRTLAGRLSDVLAAYHSANPLRAGMSREELKSRLRLEAKVFAAAAEAAISEGIAVDRGSRLALAEHRVTLSRDQASRVEALRARFGASPASPPSVKECVEALGDEVWGYLVESGEFAVLSPDVAFERAQYDRMVQAVRDQLAGGRTITVAEVRDRFNTSRKYALALMEHLDEIGVTVREGDARKLARE